ncbi:MAG TPA: hypothetical protein VMU49_00305 [Candidatus Acidoferrales bacterium]|nr:hypothetical protein [Candidatus Acidoferrales bacterium]
MKVSIPQPLRDRLVDGRNWIGLGAPDEVQQSVRIAVLCNRAVIQSDEGSPLHEPGRQINVGSEFLEVVRLSPDAVPREGHRTPQWEFGHSSEHHHLVIAEQYLRIGTVASKPQSPDSKGAKVDQIAKEYSAPFVRRELP